jgi:imidazole glycerol-phosphate synthase subunit HisH
VGAEIAIVDYGVGNVGSIQNMLKKVGARSVLASSPDQILEARKLILPGVGAVDAGMDALRKSGLIDALSHQALQVKVPVIGLCLGMQLMTERSEEGSLPGLGWIRAQTVRFAPLPGLKIPHMGWNLATPAKQSAILKQFPDGARFYFVHSYYVTCANPSDALLFATYGSTRFAAGVQHENLIGVQFHPEKSHRFGMWLLRNFAEC